MKNVIAVYKDFPTANAVVRALVEHGVPRNEISMISLDEQGNFKKEILHLQEGEDKEERQGLAKGAGAGAGIGAVLGGLGGLLVGLGVFSIPGLGPVLAAGPMAAAITGLAGGAVGAVSGGVVGGLIGMLTDMGVPEEKAELYLENIRHGGILVAAHVEDSQALGVRAVMNEYMPLEEEGDELERLPQSAREGSQLAVGNQPAAEIQTVAVFPPFSDRLADLEQKHVEEKLAYDPEKANAFNPERQTYSVEALTHDPGSFIATEFDQGFEAFDQDYRQHYAAYLLDSGNAYDYYLPGYQYGYALAADERYRHLDWGELEPQARELWLREPRIGSWEEVRDAVRFAWEDVKAEME